MWRRSSNESRSGRSHQSCTRWPNIAPIRRASSMRCARRVEPGDAHVPADRDEDAGQHLDRRRLAGAVRPEVAEQLAALDAERDVVHRLDHAPLAPEAAARARRSCLREARRPRSSACAPVVADGEPPDEPGDARREPRRRRRREVEEPRQPERVVLVRARRARGSSRRTPAARRTRGSAAATARRCRPGTGRGTCRRR